MPYQPATVMGFEYGTAVANNVMANMWYGYDAGITNAVTSFVTMGSYTTAGTTQIPTYHAYQPTGTFNVLNVYSTWPAPVETEEEMVARLKKQAEWDEEQKVISARARELLEATLNDKQREQLQKESFFDLEVSSGRIYRIKPGRKVERLDPATRKATSLFCIHPQESLPADDIAVSQKMWLETDEEAFIRIANETKLAA